jgi:8-oxo-dGTP pyrophosphatase MutT (NUDIX family)
VTEIPTGRVVAETTEPIESASVMLLRDGTDGVEVLMLERHVESDFAGGALVFPGGKVDGADRRLPSDRWEGLDPRAVAEEMEAPRDVVLGWHVSAVRETFEEAGILLARRGGRPIAADVLAEDGVQEARRCLQQRGSSWDWSDWLADEGLVLDLAALHWWSWWVTPDGLHRRYETRFFVAEVPAGQAGEHDAVETTSLRWTTPRGALVAGREGSATVIYPTRKNLEVLAGFASAAEAIEAARTGVVDRRRTVPEIVRGEGGEIRIRHPHTGEMEPP